MKMIKLLVSASLVVATSPAFVTPAYAVPANSTTETRMANTCAALVDATAKLHDGTPVYSTTVLNVVESEQAPVNTDTEVPGSRVGTGTPTYSGLSIGAGPYRIGGSVNMFGDQVATTKTYPGYTYKFDRVSSVTTNYTFGCEITQATEHFVPPVDIPGHKVQGFYVNCDFGHGNGNDNGGETVCDANSGSQQSCAAHNATGDSLPFWGEDTEQCKFIKTGDAVDAVHIDGYWVDDADIVTTVPGKTDSQIDITNSYGLDGVSNLPLVLTGNWFVGQVVICISPSTGGQKGVPGAWRTQNGYGGGSLVGPAKGCNTPYFKIAPWGGGSQDSNGTYISVPGY